MAKHSNVGWLNSNETRDYPFKDGVTLGNGSNSLPQNFLVDAVFSGATEGLRYRIGSVEVLSNAVQVVIHDSDGTIHGRSNIATPLTTKYQSQFFQPDSTTTSLTGKLVFGKGVNEVASWGVGVYHFGFSSTEFTPTVLGPTEGNTGVTSLGVFGDTENILTGDVKLQAGDGVVLTTIGALNTIRLDLSKQYALNCPDQLDKYDRCSSCIKYINGIAPRADGTFEIVGSNWINVENDPANNRITVSFTAEVNCCCTACDEVQSLVDRVANLATDVTFLSNHVNSLP